jgi:hypothetical protein
MVLDATYALCIHGAGRNVAAPPHWKHVDISQCLQIGDEDDDGDLPGPKRADKLTPRPYKSTIEKRSTARVVRTRRSLKRLGRARTGTQNSITIANGQGRTPQHLQTVAYCRRRSMRFLRSRTAVCCADERTIGRAAAFWAVAVVVVAAMACSAYITCFLGRIRH